MYLSKKLLIKMAGFDLMATDEEVQLVVWTPL